MAKILVTGSNGQLGSELRELAVDFPQYNFVFTDRYSMPLDKEEVIEEVLLHEKPDFIINAGAYTAVDKAESEPDLAHLINCKSVECIGKWTAKNDVKLIHISTDYVFDGESNSPLEEDAETNPINVYGHTKLKGESSLMEFNSNSVIIRTSWVYSKYGNNFVKTMRRLMSERETLSIVDDQVGSPTSAHDLAKAILTIISGVKWTPGLYHYSNEGEISWYDFACAIKDLSNLSCKLLPISSSDFPTPARRPKYSLLDKAKIKNEYNIEIPLWEISLKQMLEKL